MLSGSNFSGVGSTSIYREMKKLRAKNSELKENNKVYKDIYDKIVANNPELQNSDE